MTDYYFKMLTAEKSRILAKVFELSVENGYESKAFAKDIMCNPKLQFLMEEDEVPDWCDGWFLLSTFERYIEFKKGETVGKDEMWFLGYLYRYWIRTRNMSSKEVYKILPFKDFDNRYAFYSCEGWEYIIQNATDYYNEYKLKNKKKRKKKK